MEKKKMYERIFFSLNLFLCLFEPGPLVERV